jgi:hypothetical protein
VDRIQTNAVISGMAMPAAITERRNHERAYRFMPSMITNFSRQARRRVCLKVEIADAGTSDARL